ncbi:MAG: hypothetical protein KIS92_13305 [Planctomycetota bacterium]|nr:hypothetical protein [Planctomycetota bacterium]
MVDLEPVLYRARYAVTNVPAVARTLRNLPEFTRGRPMVDAEEFIWIVPQARHGRTVNEPVATVRLSGCDLLVECRSRHAMRAMRVLIESLVGYHVERAQDTQQDMAVSK